MADLLIISKIIDFIAYGKVVYLQITTTAAEELFDWLLHVCCILSNMAVASSIFNCKKN